MDDMKPGTVEAMHQGTCTPYIIYRRFARSFVFVGDIAVAEVESVPKALFILFAVYYTLTLPYSKHVSGALLYMQKEILGDNVHRSDASTLAKCSKGFLSFFGGNDSPSKLF